MDIFLVKLTADTSRGRMAEIIEEVLKTDRMQGLSIREAEDADGFIKASEKGLLKNTHIIFAAELDESGINIEAYRILRYLHTSEAALEGSVGGIIIDGAGDLFTKDLGRKLAFAASMAGCTFPGKPLAEATGSLRNYTILAESWNTSLRGAYKKSCSNLIEKVLSFDMPKIHRPAILAVHASSRKTSNSLALWEKIVSNLEGLADIEEISIRNGQVWDCRGCKYEECLHFGENSACFYGGVMVERVYPAILRSDIVVLICPNYNDSVSANIMAFINRLTAVFRTNDFSRRKVFALVISGYSGGDLVAQQIIGAMNMNKNFILPAGFAMIETANAPGDIMRIEDIDDRAKKFAENMLK